MTKIYFVDFEASSLAPGSYPIEIAWVDANGQGESYLIKPAPGWDNWSSESQAVHGISRDQLQRDGTPHDRVARRAAAALGAERSLVFADQPICDDPWMRKLLSSAALTHIPVLDVTQLYGQACRPLLDAFTRDEVASIAQRIVAEAENAQEMRGRKRHRALPDAEGLWWTWREVGRRVKAVIEERHRPSVTLK